MDQTVDSWPSKEPQHILWYQRLYSGILLRRLHKRSVPTKNAKVHFICSVDPQKVTITS